MDDQLVNKIEIEPDTIIVNGVEYRKVVPEEREPTLTNIIKFWEANSITLRDKNRNYDLYNQDIERLVKMIEGWLPPEKDLHVYHDKFPHMIDMGKYAINTGWNDYRDRLMSKLR